MIRKHPPSDFLVEYSSGNLSIAPAVSVTAHLQFCDHCRDLVASLNNIGGELLDESEATPVSDHLLDSVLACIDDEEHEVSKAETSKPAKETSDIGLPPYIEQLLPAEQLTWRYLSPSLKVSAISIGEDVHELALHRIKAGGKAPEHNHRGTEITVVLKGSFSDEDGVYQPGDFILREAGEIHRPCATHNEECICLSVLAAPIKLTGIKRVLNPFLSFAPS